MFIKMFHAFISKGLAAVTAVALMAGVAVVSSPKAMAVIDVTAVTGGLSDATTAIVIVAAGMLLVAGAGIGIKWLLGFLFS